MASASCAPLPHACIGHTSKYGGGIGIPPCVCLLASCAAPPSSLATEDDPSYSSFIFIFFVGTRNPSSN
jgi:hypothetical protein